MCDPYLFREGRCLLPLFTGGANVLTIFLGMDKYHTPLFRKDGQGERDVRSHKTDMATRGAT